MGVGEEELVVIDGTNHRLGGVRRGQAHHREVLLEAIGDVGKEA
jgi:hypothetical protein